MIIIWILKPDDSQKIWSFIKKNKKKTDTHKEKEILDMKDIFRVVGRITPPFFKRRNMPPQVFSTLLSIQPIAVLLRSW